MRLARPAVVCALLAGLLAHGATGWAHARLVRSTPANGAVLATAPTKLVLAFNSDVERRFARFVLELPDGTTRALARPPGDGMTREVTIALGALGTGKQRVRWSVVSRDGHRIEGAIRFTVKER